MDWDNPPPDVSAFVDGFVRTVLLQCVASGRLRDSTAVSVQVHEAIISEAEEEEEEEEAASSSVDPLVGHRNCR